DAWDIDAGYAEQGQFLPATQALDVVEAGPHRVAVRVERSFRSSRIVQDIRLWANSPRLEFVTTIDWHDRHWLLKARFPLAVRSERATCDVAFGVVERPTHNNTSWEQARFEVVAHRFVDLADRGYGVALLNDGKYGHDLAGNVVGLSLLRSPAYPDPRADEGTQTFTYALCPHTGNWVEGGVLMEAEDLNRPLFVTPVTAAEEKSWQPLAITGLPLALGALKVREDGGGLVLRVYEPQGAAGSVEVQPPFSWDVGAELDLLEDEIGTPDFEFTPFKVRTWLLTR
ncbi:MAG TPA: glycoside hydrolase family 38 C-terminal domain-containing protein, partial [Mycobacterium sp.]|uniref:glycoside hydrolase family 38 C-terminal domain-containing protein n=1 Tax=Mycobacterium sp. TaxID=1785 RepID=UPI002D2ACFB3